jgi:hypothetical protein
MSAKAHSLRLASANGLILEHFHKFYLLLEHIHKLFNGLEKVDAFAGFFLRLD